MDDSLSEFPKWAPFFILLVGMTILAWAMARKVKMRAEQEMRQLADSLGGRLSGPYIELPGIHPDARLWFETSRVRGPLLILRLPAALDFDLHILRETRLPFGGDGMQVYFHSSDSEFDSKYLFSSCHAGTANRFLDSPLRREIVDFFFANGFAALIVEQGFAYAQKKEFTPDDLAPETVMGYLRMLKRFVE